jgi:hypothetical protein
MRISKRTQQIFGDFCSTHGVLRTIREVFEAEGFSENEDFDDPKVWGERRTLAASFHSAIDMDDESQQYRLLRVYLHAIDDWGRDYLDGTLRPDAVRLVRALRRDGAPIDENGNLVDVETSPVALPLDDFGRLSQPDVLFKHLERIRTGLKDDPALAIASAKELLESTCKFVLDDYGISYSSRAGAQDLYRNTARALKIDREAVPGNKKGSESARKILQNLATTVQAMAELRNELGLGHGKTKNSEALERHARLAFNASRTVVEFVLQTWDQRRKRGAGPS